MKPQALMLNQPIYQATRLHTCRSLCQSHSHPSSISPTRAVRTTADPRHLEIHATSLLKITKILPGPALPDPGKRTPSIQPSLVHPLRQVVAALQGSLHLIALHGLVLGKVLASGSQWSVVAGCVFRICPPLNLTYRHLAAGVHSHTSKI